MLKTQEENITHESINHQLSHRDYGIFSFVDDVNVDY